MPKNFLWKSGSQPPRIEDHSKQKLKVLKHYLDTYFDTIIRDPRTDKVNITLVDGFSGGGVYKNEEEIYYGSPLVLLQAVRDAEKRLNENRSKPLKINAKFHFIDNNKDHCAYLKETIKDAGYWDQYQGSIEIHNAKFSTVLQKILSSIRSKQHAGRSIFVLDQFGYSDVPMPLIQSIFNNLNRAEVILTFAIDALLNFLREDSSAQEVYRQFGVDDRLIDNWKARKSDEALGRLVTQRALMSHISLHSGAKFFTPFMLWSKTDNRWMMLAHLSQHQAARDKMLGVHWEFQNSFRHIGRGSLFSLGYDARLVESRNSLFSFTKIDKQTLSTELENELPTELRALISDNQIAIAKFLEKIGNRTAALNSDIFSILRMLAQDRDIEVFSKEGRIKRPNTAILVSDTIRLPSQQKFFSYLK